MCLQWHLIAWNGLEFILKAAELLFNTAKKKREKASFKQLSPQKADGYAAAGIAGKLQAVTFPSSVFEHLSLEQWKREQGHLPLRWHNQLFEKQTIQNVCNQTSKTTPDMHKPDKNISRNVIKWMTLAHLEMVEFSV